LYDKFYDKMSGLKLYVRRVLISDEFDDFLPRYLNFIRGVVDSDDLPLNVNREQLAQNRVLKVMAKKITRKVLEMLQKLADTKDDEKDKKDDQDKEDDKDNEDLYTTFWSQYAKSIKLGVVDDRSNRAKLAKLLRFQTTKSEGKTISLQTYVDRMKDKQKNIFFITGESIDQVKNSPFLEKLMAKDYEVVLMVDPLDEYLVQALTDFEGHSLQSVTKEGLKLDDEHKNRLKKLDEEFKDLSLWLKGVYGDRVEKVQVSNRIAKSPAVLVTGQYGWSANMERIMRAQTFSQAEEAPWMHSRKIMEINPYHPVIKELKQKVAANPEDKTVKDLANLMYDAALVTSGFQVRDPLEFASRINRVISTGLAIDPEAAVDQEPEHDDEDPKEEADESSESPIEVEPAHDEL